MIPGHMGKPLCVYIAARTLDLLHPSVVVGRKGAYYPALTITTQSLFVYKGIWKLPHGYPFDVIMCIFPLYLIDTYVEKVLLTNIQMK